MNDHKSKVYRRKTYREGTRVRYIGPPLLGPKPGSTGRVAKVATIGGKKSVHPDPLRLLTFVEWDDGHGEGVYTRHLDHCN